MYIHIYIDLCIYVCVYLVWGCLFPWFWAATVPSPEQKPRIEQVKMQVHLRDDDVANQLAEGGGLWSVLLSVHFVLEPL